MYKTLFAVLLSTIILTGCETNPVTGKRQLSLVSSQQELSIGNQQYKPSQQSQGGVYTIDPSVNRYVNNVGQKLAKLSGQPNLPYEFVVLNNGAANAWALPGGKIAINRGLLSMLEDEAQLAAVLGHEVVHSAARHSASQMSRSTLLQIGAQIVGQVTENNAYAALAGAGASAVNAKYGRNHELEADYYGIQYMVGAGYNPQAAVELQQTLLSLSKGGAKSSWLDNLFASHPPSAERVSKNKDHARQYPKGVRKKAAYQQAMGQIKKDQKAYQLHDEALVAAKNKDWKKAQSLTKQAIKAQPKEARFHITKGRLLDQQKDNSGAIAAFNQAAKLEPHYFASTLYRGLSYQKTKQYNLAEKDLVASNKQLETGIAYYHLGEIAQTNKKRNAAIDHYKKAAQGNSDIAKAAAGKLKQMGIQ